ncbi:hypothetical protein [Limosilactobacillus reuteri]|uniref:Uncharacterized protein n=1 Tax=Limosilactobacillus reuteri subsp. rodentium (strain DSM 17509 / CIP 109821 / 100-23) TaxID=349123 RepID=B3XPW5_LIMR1|nr:hypothetical protein [Limosilactobacillus reuteri]EDX42966.1 hypothetical protein Lreu23DRAFT_4485 [Limosilactobacillus reuteri subsp. rodentium]MCC4475100.1 hypothetical protein [Limosilactobacillus reuteri]
MDINFYRELFKLLELEEEDTEYGKQIMWPSLESLRDEYLDRLADFLELDRDDYTKEGFLEVLRKRHVPEGLMENTDPRYPYPD